MRIRRVYIQGHENGLAAPWTEAGTEWRRRAGGRAVPAHEISGPANTGDTDWRQCR